MASSLILSVQDGSIAFGEKQIFENLNFNIHQNDKISLVGNNGTGKTTLMKIITGVQDMDDGERWMLQGTTIGYLQQDIKVNPDETVYDFVFEQLKKSGDAEAHQYKVNMVIEPLDLNPNDKMGKLSGGQIRRASLARALVEEPDVLLLDEPTNHLDLDVIEWLEKYLKQYRGAVLCVSHDKAFLSTISDKVFWLDRGNMRVCPRGFAHFDEWSTMLLEQEARELHNRQKTVDQEVAWGTKGVKARRKRNVRRLEQMREERDRLKKDVSAYNRMMRTIKVGEMEDDVMGSRVIAEFIKVYKNFTDGDRETIILDNFNIRLSRGDRIGVLGKNGSGKTSFLKLLIGELEPDMGKVKRAKTLEISYFDQKRQDLKLDETVKHTLCPSGGDYLDVMGKTRHVCGYLKDFLFDPAMVEQKVGTLSGGQKNRLLLAKVLADPKGLLILDEPTNDLDMDTLDMLEEILSHYKGTLIAVSHDRDFLDQTVSKILAFEGSGVVEGYIGGYTDYLEKRKERARANNKTATISQGIDNEKQNDKQSVSSFKPSSPKPSTPSNRKLTYKLQYELDHLPKQMEDLETELKTLNALMANTTLYERDIDLFQKTSLRIAEVKAMLQEHENRWLELEEMRLQIMSE